MSSSRINVEIGEILGLYDMSGADAISSDQIEHLEYLVAECNRSSGLGEDLVVNAIYDRMVEVLKVLNPDSPILDEVWGEDVTSEEDMTLDIHRLVKAEPMRSIQTCKSFTCAEYYAFLNALMELNIGTFDIHASMKLNGHGIRLVYQYGLLEGAYSRARSSSGRDLTRVMTILAKQGGYYNVEAFSGMEQVEVRGELLLPFSNFQTAKGYKPDIVSPFSGVSSMSRDSASDEEISLLRFVAYKIVGDGFSFPTKESFYDFLEDAGFEVPMNIVARDIELSELQSESAMLDFVSDMSDMVVDEDGNMLYDYFTDGIILEVDDCAIFSRLGSNGNKYYFGNVALKVGYWQQDMYTGFIQAIMWTQGKSKLSPVAIVSDEPDVAEFDWDETPDYIQDIKEIINYNKIGVITAGGNKVRRVPLYEPNNILLLHAYVGCTLNFRYGGEAGVVPCTEGGVPLKEAKLKEVMSAEPDQSYDEDDDGGHNIGDVGLMLRPFF